MKRTVALILSLILVALCGCTAPPREEKKQETDLISAVWIYFSELSMKSENGGTAEFFEKKIGEMLDNCADLGINTVFIQVRPCCDAFYRSDIFPWTSYLTGTQGKSVDYDPLEIAVKLAHQRGMTVHAWINPFRVSFDSDKSKLAEDNPARKWLESDDKKLNSLVVNVNGGLYFSPPSQTVQKLVLDGVRELLKKYDIDGIHIDDYFYPSAEKKVDEVFYNEYLKNGGKLKLSEWRLNVISAFVSAMYSAVKAYDSDCIFSVSPAGNISNNYESQFADVKLWCAEAGYADWIIPQLYYGFDDEILPFDKACDQWSSLDRSDTVKMIYGIAAYKVGEAGEEWTPGNGVIKRQLDYAKSKDGYGGAAFFSYSSLVSEKKRKEFAELKNELSTQLAPQSGGEESGREAQQKPKH